MKILVKGGRIIDPSTGLDGAFDILIEGKKVKEIFKKGTRKIAGARVIDASENLVIPGLVDMHTHLREPGFEYKETIKTGTMAAVRGGFTSLCAMPNTSPVNDNAGITEFILQKAEKDGSCSVFPAGAITKGQRGEELAEMGMMREAGCVAFTDDGRPVMDSLVMRRALEYSRAFNTVIISHAEDLTLSEGGVMNEGLLSQSMGLRGIPTVAEETMVFRDIALAELTGGRLHITHVSTEGSVRIIRDAKRRGISVTADTCPHYFTLTEDACMGYNTNARVNPPLRTIKDVIAIKEGLKDGTLDAVATDHAPHGSNEKAQEFDVAPSGISGLETALSLSLGLVREGILTLKGLVTKMSTNPARLLSLNKGKIEAGGDADIVIIDLKKRFMVDSKGFVSKGKNTPFDGLELEGTPVVTISMGKVYEWQ